ncbi:hypothetical protein AHAS_Ahas13G0399100 [Arachis hypogaea]
MFKIIWQAMKNPEALWVKVLSHKYCNGRRLNNNALNYGEVLQVSRQGRRIEKLVNWKSLPEGWVKLNSDRSGRSSLLRNNKGRWIAGFSHQTGEATAFTAELWGVVKGLELTWTMGFRKVVVEVDAVAVVQRLNVGKKLASHLVIRKVNEWKRKDWSIFFVQIYREGNRCSDCLAKKSLSLDDDFVFWDLPSPKLVSILSDDERGAALPRLVCI